MYSTVWFQFSSCNLNLHRNQTYYTVLVCCRHAELCGNTYSWNNISYNGYVSILCGLAYNYLQYIG